MPFFGQNLSFLPLNLARGLKMNQFLFQLVIFLITLLLIPILLGKSTKFSKKKIDLNLRSKKIDSRSKKYRSIFFGSIYLSIWVSSTKFHKNPRWVLPIFIFFG